VMQQLPQIPKFEEFCPDMPHLGPVLAPRARSSGRATPNWIREEGMGLASRLRNGRPVKFVLLLLPASPIVSPIDSQFPKEGATRRFVACSNANASSIRRGSLQALPVKLTPKGAGLALKSSGNGGVGAFGIKANGTMTVG
jgi:hypothetical protein